MKIYLLNGNCKKYLTIEIKEHGNKCTFTKKHKLISQKSKIDQFNQNIWNKSKKNMNIYEYIYTSSNLRKNICNINPISRSYFKLHEILKSYHFNISTCCCIAEGPGGFIHCLNDNDENMMNYGITLISDDKSIPYWNNNLVINPKNKISFGNDGTGDIYKSKNTENFINEVGKGKCDLVTGDGGFDYSLNYNLQELSSYRLLFCEIYIALNVQKKGGNFILKIFDLFYYQTIQLIYLLYNCYSKIEFFKPNFSRLSNSEKYMICSDFLGCPDNILKQIKDNYENLNQIWIDIPYQFITMINEYNEIFTDIQINEIMKIIKNIKNKNIKEYPTGIQIRNALKWCELYSLPINKDCIYLN